MTEIEYQIVKSNRKTISIQINPDLSVTVRVPRRATKRDVERILREKQDWIIKNREKLRERQLEAGTNNAKRLSEDEIRVLAKQAKNVIPQKVAYYAEVVGVDYGRIAIRHQRTRWGSCSGKGNLNFNCLLMLAPDEVIDYVVVHELCHRKEMNHSKAFWNEVAKVLPDYKKQIKWLKEEGRKLEFKSNE